MLWCCSVLHKLDRDIMIIAKYDEDASWRVV